MELTTYYTLAQKAREQKLIWQKQQTTVLYPPHLSALFSKPEIGLQAIKTEPTQNTSIILTASPEAYAVTTAFLEWKEKKLQLCSARLHTGPLRSMDVATATYQALQLPILREYIKKLADPARELVVVDLLREGPKTQVQDALYWIYKIKPTTALMSITHVADNTTSLGRKAVIQQPNFEGIDPDQVKMVILSDPIAGGVTQFFALEYLRNKFVNLKDVVIVAPHLAAYGGLALCQYAEEKKLSVTILGFGALLQSVPPEMYFSPTPVEKVEWFADERHAKLVKFLYGDAASKLCVAGNWTAMFLAPCLGVQWFSDELKSVQLTIDEVAAKQPTLEQLKEWKFTVTELVPVSSYVLAQQQNELGDLQNALLE